MELEWDNPIIYAITIVLWLIIAIMIWKMMLPAETNVLFSKILMTVLIGPIIFLIVNMQVHK